MHSSQKTIDSKSSMKLLNEPNFDLFISGDLQSISIGVIGTEKELFKYTVNTIFFRINKDLKKVFQN